LNYIGKLYQLESRADREKLIFFLPCLPSRRLSLFEKLGAIMTCPARLVKMGLI